MPATRYNPAFEDEQWQRDKPDWKLSSPRALTQQPYRVLRRLLDFIRPSFSSPASDSIISFTTGVKDRFPSGITEKLNRSQGNNSNSPPLRRTAYLDGLRGFAALLVYWMHHQLWAHDALSTDITPNSNAIFETAFGYQGQYYFACLPFVRMFFSGGHLAVTVFFVISGYVLSNKPLSIIYASTNGNRNSSTSSSNDGSTGSTRTGAGDPLSENLASALFRRWLRLHLPILATTFLYLTSWHAFGLWTASPLDRQATWGRELWTWWAEFKNFSFVFRTGGEGWFNYNYHAWSVPVEFRGSVVVYTALLALSRCRRDARLAGEAALVWYFLYVVDGWFCAMFVSGMMLCDLDMLARHDDLPRFIRALEPSARYVFPLLLVAGVYLGGVPAESFELQLLRDSPGWHYLSFLKPQAVFDFKWFYLFWGSTFVVAAVPRVAWLKAFFETRFCQYLGHISFGFYLVHGPVLWILGDRLYVATGWSREWHAMGLPAWINAFPLPKAGPVGLELSFLLPHLILLPVTLWLADLTTRFLDEPSVRFSHWLYRKTLNPAASFDRESSLA